MIKIPLTETYIDQKSLIKKKTPAIDEKSGVYMITGVQGSGKTYHAIDLATRLYKDMEILTNINSLKLPHTYYNSIEQYTKNRELNKLFIIDEISTKYPKECRTDREFYQWLQKTRKRKSIVILITQEWKEVPFWLRRPVKVQITTNKLWLSKYTGIYKTVWGDGENLKYNKEEQEYECPTIRTIYTKRNIETANLYDTFEFVELL